MYTGESERVLLFPCAFLHEMDVNESQGEQEIYQPAWF